MGYWKLDEGSGNFADSSGNGNAGTEAGTLSRGQTGKVNKAATWDGDDKVTVNHSTSLLFNDISYGFWYKGIPVSTMHVITKWKNAGQNVFNNYFQGSNIKFSYSHDGTNEGITVTSVGAILNDNTWHHVFNTLDDSANTMKVYIDGVLDNTIIDGGWSGLRQGTDDINIGGVLDGTDLTGSVDDIRIYNRTLSAAEIQMIYNANR